MFLPENSPAGESLYDEWILTNSLGGYALGFGNLINKRKYNGLLTASTENFKRIHLVSSIEEQFKIGDAAMYADSNRYTDTLYPHGYSYLVKSWLRPYPTFLYSSSLADRQVLILKEIYMHKARNITLVKYTNLGPEDIEFLFRYKFTLRDHHEINHPGIFDSLSLSCEIIENEKTGFFIKHPVKGIDIYTYISSGCIKENITIYRNIFYELESSRGYDSVEDLISPCMHSGTLKTMGSLEVLFSDAMIDLPDPDLMLDDFKTKDDIIAGYPWFSSWGRDTMISLEAYIKKIIRTTFFPLSINMVKR